MSREIPLKAVLSPLRKGYAKGIKDGLKLVEAEYVLITDSDGQHDPKDFWRLWNLRDRYDVISGWRKRRADPFYRKVMSKVFQLMLKYAFDLPSFLDVTAPFKLMKTSTAREIADECKYMSESLWSEFTVRAYVKDLSIVEVPVDHRKKVDGNSTRFINLGKYQKLHMPNLLRFSSLNQSLTMRREDWKWLRLENLEL